MPCHDHYVSGSAIRSYAEQICACIKYIIMERIRSRFLYVCVSCSPPVYAVFVAIVCCFGAIIPIAVGKNYGKQIFFCVPAKYPQNEIE